MLNKKLPVAETLMSMITIEIWGNLFVLQSQKVDYLIPPEANI